MAKEAKIDPGSQTGPSFCFAGFGTDRLRCEQAMKTAERENPNRRPQCVANRADGAASQYRSCSIMWAAKQENFQPAEKCFFLTSPFIELTGCAVKRRWSTAGVKPARELVRSTR